MLKLVLYTGEHDQIYEVVSQKDIEIQTSKIIFTAKNKEKITTNLPYKIVEF